MKKILDILKSCSNIEILKKDFSQDNNSIYFRYKRIRRDYGYKIPLRADKENDLMFELRIYKKWKNIFLFEVTPLLYYSFYKETKNLSEKEKYFDKETFENLDKIRCFDKRIFTLCNSCIKKLPKKLYSEIRYSNKNEPKNVLFISYLLYSFLKKVSNTNIFKILVARLLGINTQDISVLLTSNEIYSSSRKEDLKEDLKLSYEQILTKSKIDELLQKNSTISSKLIRTNFQQILKTTELELKKPGEQFRARVELDSYDLYISLNNNLNNLWNKNIKNIVEQPIRYIFVQYIALFCIIILFSQKDINQGLIEFIKTVIDTCNNVFIFFYIIIYFIYYLITYALLLMIGGCHYYYLIYNKHSYKKLYGSFD